MTILVLAGNTEQAKRFILTNFKPQTKYVIANHVAKVLSTRADQLEVIGTFWERQDAGDMYRLAQSRLTTTP